MNDLVIRIPSVENRLAAQRQAVRYYEPEEDRTQYYPTREVTTNYERQEIAPTRQSQLARLHGNFSLPAHNEERPATSIQQFIEVIKRALVQYGIACQFGSYVDYGDKYAIGFNTRVEGLDDRQMIALQYVGDALRRELGEVRTGFDMDGRFARVLVWVTK